MKTRTAPAKKYKYSDFVEAQSYINKVAAPHELPIFTIIYGPSDYLVLKSYAALKKKFPQHFGGSFAAAETTQESLLSMLEASALFAPHPIYFIRKLEEKAEQFWRVLSSIPAAPISESRFVMTYRGASLPVKLMDELIRLKGFFIPCVEPAPAEIPRFIGALGKKYGIRLDNAACALLRDALGDDLTKLDNEISKLGMLYDKEGAIGVDHIAPHLTLLREDHVFTIDSLLVQKKKGEAIQLIQELLHRGEESLLLLGVVANHCRKSLKILSLIKKGVPAAQIAEHLHLPGHVVRGYTGYVRNVNERTFINTLTRCAEADIKLKTSSQRDADITVTNVLMELPN